jgi:hypothetical protein
MVQDLVGEGLSVEDPGPKFIVTSSPLIVSVSVIESAAKARKYSDTPVTSL